VYVVFAGGSDYVERCFKEYGLVTDRSGQYSALYKPFHLIGLELGISVASVGLRNEPTGAPIGFNADVVATAKRDLAAGELLDGEGGSTVYGKVMPAEESLRIAGLPLGLAHKVRLVQAVGAGQQVRWSDVEISEDELVVTFRRTMERTMSGGAEQLDIDPREERSRVAARQAITSPE
jgi:predicted homoserine dehydrogenase-like protein